MNSSDMGIVSQFIGSIVKFDAYKKFKELPFGKALTYLLVITLVFGTIDLIKPAITFNDEIKEMAEVFKQEFPDFKLEKGEFNFKGRMPYIKADKDGENAIIIDTTGITKSTVLDKYKKGVFITKNKFLYKKNIIDTREYDFNNFKDYPITKSDVEGLLGYSFVAVILFVIFSLIGFMLGKMFSALLVASFGLILGIIMKVKMDYGDLYKLSIYALTAPIIVDVALDMVKVDLPLTAYYAFAAVFLALGLHNCKTEEIPAVTS